MHPPRHALGALLIEQGQYEEAEEVYRDDLGLSDKIQRCAQHPDNVWALHGLVECLRTRDDKRELPLSERKLAAALQKSRRSDYLILHVPYERPLARHLLLGGPSYSRG